MTTKSEPFIYNRAAETMPRPEIQALQLERIRQVVERVYASVPFYRQALDELSLSADKIRTLADVSALPLTCKADLRDNYPFGLFSAKPAEIVRLHASSGTRGKPTVVGYTRGDLDIWAEVCARSLGAAGARPGDVLHNSYGYGLFTGGLGMHYGGERFGATVVPASGGKTQQQVMLLADFGARILCSTPSYALNLAYTMEECAVGRESLKLEIGIFGAEPWTEELRQQIEERLRISAVDIYGLSEIIGPGVSMECAAGRDGLHIWEDHFYPEIIDPATLEVLPPGEEGELVLTSMTREGIALLRYRTGDISTLNPEPCRCGRTMVRMRRVRARLDDMLIIRGVNLYPSEVEKVLLAVEELSPNYQLVINRDKALDELDVQVEVTEEIISRWGRFEDGHLELSALTQRIVIILKENLGLTAKVTLLPPRTLTRSEGKAVRVIDRRPRSAT